MPNIAKVLKEEIQRLSRHEVKTALASLRKDNAVLKRTVAELKRRLAKLESLNKRLEVKTKTSRAQTAGVEEEKVKSARITAKMIRSIRNRLGLSQNAFAKLAGVSSQAVYQWERKGGRLDLRGNRKTVIVGIRKMGKTEAKERLAALAGRE